MENYKLNSLSKTWPWETNVHCRTYNRTTMKLEVTRRTNGGGAVIKVHANLAGQVPVRQRGWGKWPSALHLGIMAKPWLGPAIWKDFERSSPLSGFPQLEGFYLWIGLGGHNKGGCWGRCPPGGCHSCSQFPVGKVVSPDSLWKLCFCSFKWQHLCFQSISGVFLTLSCSYWTTSSLWSGLLAQCSRGDLDADGPRHTFTFLQNEPQNLDVQNI